MKKPSLIVLFAALALLTACGLSRAETPITIGGGARYHVAHSEVEDWPFADGDLSYGLFYEYHDARAYWQLGVNYAPESGLTNTVDYILTPQLNLMFRDNAWIAGFGILSHYTEDSEAGDDWSDILWQFSAGLAMPVKRVNLEILAHYVMESVADITKFDFDDVEFSGVVTFTF